MRICILSEKHAHDWERPRPRRQHQRRLTVPCFDRVRFYAAQQALHAVQVTAARSVKQFRRAGDAGRGRGIEGRGRSRDDRGHRHRGLKGNRVYRGHRGRHRLSVDDMGRLPLPAPPLFLAGASQLTLLRIRPQTLSEDCFDCLDHLFPDERCRVSGVLARTRTRAKRNLWASHLLRMSVWCRARHLLRVMIRSVCCRLLCVCVLTLQCVLPQLLPPRCAASQAPSPPTAAMSQ
mmetsp:Transcript_28539/g.63280  ORF Transcript_28539/g.63280 Transcript_28539/m.63280 type:complete len:234 (-) Transcript_28539:192-893(-)